MWTIIRTIAAVGLTSCFAVPLAIGQEFTTEECDSLAKMTREIAMARDEGVPLSTLLSASHREEDWTERERRAFATMLAGVYRDGAHLSPGEIYSETYLECLRGQ